MDGSRNSLAGRLYGGGGLGGRLSAASPLPPPPASDDALGSTSVTASHLEKGLVPKPTLKRPGLGGTSTALSLSKSTSLVALRATAGPSAADHPLAHSVGKLKSSQAAAASAPRRMLQPITMAKDRVSKLSLRQADGLGSTYSSSMRRPAAGRGVTESKFGDYDKSAPEDSSGSDDGRKLGDDGDDDDDDAAAAAAAAAAATGAHRRHPQDASSGMPRTFIESLCLSEEEIEELSRGNFLYLKPAGGMESNAYDLHVVAHSETDPRDYYTLSRQGLTHFLGKDSEFTPLEQWERDFRLFRRIYAISFFQSYRLWKNFTVWKKNVRGGKCGLASRALDGGLFVLNPTLRMSLFRLRRLCVEVTSWQLFESAPDVTYDLDDFVDLQAKRRAQTTVWLQQFSDDVRALVRGACDEVLDKFLADNGIQADHKMTFMERAALRTECRKLTKYIRLTEFLVRDTLLDLALDSTAALREWVQPGGLRDPNAPADAQPPLFRVEAAFNVDPSTLAAQEAANQRQAEAKARAELEALRKESADAAGDDGAADDEQEESKAEVQVPDLIDYDAVQLVVHPQIDVVRTKLQDVVLDAVSVVSGPTTLMDHPDLSPYTQAATDDADESAREDADLTETVKAHGGFQTMCEDVFAGVATAFQNVDSYSALFTPFKRTFLANEVALDRVEDKYPHVGLEVFERDIARYKAQTADFEDIPASKAVGILMVDSEALRVKLLPSPLRCLAAIQALLPQLMHHRSEVLLDDVTKRSSVLGSRPTEVEPFVTKVGVLEDTAEKLAGLREEQSQIKAMARLMEANAWPVPDTQNAHFTMLKESLAQLENHMGAAEAALDTDTRKFAADVEARVPVLKRNVLGVREKMDDPMIGSADADVATVVKFIDKQVATMKGLREEAERLQHYQSMLKQPVQEFDTIEDVQFDLNLKEKLWKAMESWDAACTEWMAAPFQDFDAEKVGMEVAQYLKTAVRAERGLPGNAAAPKLKALVDEFKTLLPAIVDLRTPALKPRHWEEIEAVIEHTMDPDHVYTVGELLGLNVVEHQEAIAAVATQAVQEHALEELFETKVQVVWADLEFILNPYKESKDVFILGSVEEITVALDDSLVTLNTILGSRYCAPIREEVQGWQKRLILLSDTLDEWLQCQKQWMYLETIFAADDIKRQLPDESKKFSNVDKSWKTIMKRTNGNPSCLVAGTHKGLKETLQRHNEVLDQIQKSLEDYLETKRRAFPRFYFLSNEELLEILAQTRDPQAVQPHLRKCFDALVRLEFGAEPGSVDILAMQSPEGEKVAMTKNLKARGNVEDWLMAVQKSMQESLTKLMKQGIIDYDSEERKDFVLTHKGQIVATIAQVAWARGTETALTSEDPTAAMGEWFDVNVQQLGELTELVRGKLTKTERKVIVALVTTDVHARDIVETMRDDGVDSLGNFTWQQQLRYYFDRATDTVLVKQSNATIPYGYEYQGCTSRLVITPLTDRCWMTITGAVHLKLGANPAGPAGTGKTESSKDLAKAMAIQCIVFNCSDQIDYHMMGTLFSGLAQAGAWTCLDEFNRIDIEVLSVIAQQLLQLRQGMLQGAPTIEFEGRVIRLNVHAVIVTMNPGYAGRTELPDNLKVLFRPVAMMVPDYALIAEIILFAEGFDDAKNLSRKMTRLYRLSSEQLSQQRHYDFGMRAVKSVLVMAGALKRANPGLSEDVVLIRAMRDSNVPKFLRDDLPLFHAIVGDLFPRVVVPTVAAGDLEAAIRNQLRIKGLQEVDKHIEKVLQLFDTFNVRFGVVVTGPTTAGKTVAYEVLAAAMTQLRQEGHESEDFQEVEINVLNPKCVSMGELYGEFNVLTQEWVDGLASTMIRAGAMSESMNRRWTVFDGPIDALWIENMNTVLDDNMTLCLANGERIKLKPEMRMLFEVQDLEVASPATVSRLGVVYMTPTNLGWRPFQLSWLQREFSTDFPAECREHLQELFDGTIDDGLEFQGENCVEPIPTVPVQQVTSLCNLFLALFRQRTWPAKWADADVRDVNKAVDSLFSFSFLWSLGGSIAGDDDGHAKWDSFMRNHKAFQGVRFGPGLLYDLFPDVKDEHLAWKKWADHLPPFSFDPAQPYFNMVVPTMDTVRFNYVLKTQLDQLKPVFFTGVTGTGKTVVVADFLNTASEMDYTGPQVVPVIVNFSAQTSSTDTQTSIEGSLEKKRKTLLGAPANKKVVVFVDDINMPAVEEYGAQPPIELLRQFQDFKGFYDREKLFWKSIENTVLVAAAAPPGGGRNPVTARFSRHFHIMCLPTSTDAVLKHIFGSILKGFLTAHEFAEDIKGIVDKLTHATVQIYNEIRVSLRPTPAKSHYTFNLRDVSKVFQGVLQILPKQCVNADTMCRLWAHEGLRVFHDRLVNLEDKQWYTDQAVDMLTKVLGRSGRDWSREALFEDTPLIFADFLRPRVDDDGPTIYEEAKDIAKLQSLLADALEDYNLTNPTQMNLVFFPDAVDHVCRISRILRQPRGNAMLVGVGGSGKQSLTRMACAIAEMKCFQIELTRGYGSVEFREDLKTIMLESGVGGKQLAFLFTDNQVVEESFVEDLNNVLNTGEVPNLWATDEFNKIVEDLRPTAAALKIPETRDNIYRLFVSRVRDNMHIVLSMSPVGDAFRVRCRQFPSLINCTTIDWYLPWPDDALLSVANRFLAEEDLGSDDVKASVAAMCVVVHQSIAKHSAEFYDELQRKVYTTPKSYLDLINLYLSVLAEKRAQLTKLRGRLATGVDKLLDANEQVAQLQEELTKLQPVLDKKSEETAVLLEQVARDQAEADKIKDKVEAEAAMVAEKAEQVSVVQADAQADLDVALPALNKAVKSLDSLSKSDITEVKSFPKPPPAVQVVMEAVCILLGQKPDWDTAKRVLSNTSFMQDLKEFDKDNISASTLRKLAKYIADPTMEVANVSKVSKAATSLCMWVHAMDVYSKVAKEVEPKKKRLAEMNAQLKAANDLLKGKQDELQAVLDKVAELRRQCDETLAEKDRLAHETELTKARLVRADKLTSGLADEKVRWAESVTAFDAQIEALVGDVLISAGCISYYGPFTGPYRQRIVAEWNEGCLEKAIPCSPEFSLQGTMGDPVQVREWQINGLPTDSTSTDSAVLVTRGKRWPLMIDPQEQAKKWIKNTEARNKLATTRLTHPNMLRTLENCIRIGQPLLLEDIGEYLDPALEPVLQKAVFKQSGRLLIHLGDSDIDYDPNFRLYLSTKLPNPHYLPEVCIKVTVINFTVTMFGLEDQLLGAVVNRERPDIEQKKNRLVVSMASDKKQLQDLEDKILKLLSESEGNILDDEELIRALGESKELSAVIKERLVESERTQEEITLMRNKYRPVAIRGALIYFVIADLAAIDPMYQYSLTYFVRLFNTCIDDSEKNDDLDIRLASLIDYLTATVYTNVCRGLFEAHKLLFSFLITISILRNREDVSTTEWLLLLRGAGLVTNPKTNPLPGVMSAQSWNLLFAIEEALPDAFEGLVDDVRKNKDVWKAWVEQLEPHQTPLPAPWDESLNLMQRMLVLKALREEKVLFAIKDFVRVKLGEHFIQTPPTSMADIHADSDPATPVIFILSVGADPTGMLYSYAKQVGFLERLRLISLGQGQGQRAQTMVEAATKSGDWVLLQNCHLAKSWMPELEKMVDGFSSEDGTASINPTFRLFLTSMPATYFPVPVLQNGVKLTNEPPKGIRANLQRSLATLDSWTEWESCDGEFADMTKLAAWKKLAFGLCFFHAVMQERRKFGPLGWNIVYEFNDSDLETSILVLKSFLEEQPRIPFDALLYVTGHINYGGRVTDDWDRRCLMNILSKFFTPDILPDGYKFSQSGVYYAPSEAPLDAYRDYVRGLPLDDGPEIFGMHENANISFQAQETNNILKTCLSIQPRTSGGKEGARSPDEIAQELAVEIERELPPQMKMSEAGKATFVYKGEHMDSLATVLGQEMVRFNKLLAVMTRSLEDLQKAIRGEVLMSDELDRMYTALLNNEVPGNWEAAAYPSLKPLAAWVVDLHARIDFLRTWLVNGQPDVFWMSGFFFPQGFTTGTLQNHARKYSQAIDTLSFDFEVLDAMESADVDPDAVPEDGVLVRGLFLDGARWDQDAGSLMDLRPREMFSLCPIIHFIPTPHFKPPPAKYACPVYKTSTRAGMLSTTGISTNFVVAVFLPCTPKDADEPVAPGDWVLKGTALLCAPDV